jgi:hypothetical protein
MAAPALPTSVLVHGAFRRRFVPAGHSYGGCVITDASTGNPNVRALVYIAAFAPDEGETLFESSALGGGTTDLGQHLVQRPYPGAPDGDADGYLDLAFFHQLFCADLDAELAAFMAVAQRGFALSCLSTPSGCPAGGPSRAGTSWPPTTPRSRRKPSEPWPSAPERRRWRSPARTSR